MSKTLTLQLVVTLALTGSSFATTIYDANTAFAADVDSASPSPSFGPFTVGYLAKANYNDAAALPAERVFTPFSPGDYVNNTLDSYYPAGVDGYRLKNNTGDPAALVNSTAGVLYMPGSVLAPLGPNEILLHPGGLGSDSFQAPIYAGDLRFTAATAGFYTFTSAFEPLHSGTTVKGVYIDGNPFLTSPSPLPVVSFDGGTYLAAGGTIDFAVGVDAHGISSDSTGLLATVTKTPDSLPTIFGGLVLLGLTGCAHLRRFTA